MIKLAQQIQDFVMIPTYRKFNEYHKGFYSPAAINLCMGTIAQEMSFCFLRQMELSYESDVGGFGWGSVEPKTLRDTRNWLAREKPYLAQKIDLTRSHTLSDKDSLIGNMHYNLLIMRSIYLSIKRPLPNYNDIEGMGDYWNRYYNRNDDHGTVAEFVAAYNRYLQP